MPPPLKTCCRPSVALHRPTQNNGRPWGESSHDGDSDRGHADFLALAASLYQAAWGALSRGHSALIRRVTCVSPIPLYNCGP